jgi:iron-sulfur cluster assembly protein
MITLTPAAIAHINRFISKRGRGVGIRLGVKTTGCSGLAYIIEYVDVPHSEDVRYEQEKFTIFIDPKSVPYFGDVVVDFKRNGLNEGFDFSNTLEKDRCGCGESFRPI